MSRKLVWSINADWSADVASLMSLFKREAFVGERCPECGGGQKQSYLFVEWREGSDRISNFVPCSPGPVVQKRVAHRLNDTFPESEEREVRMHDHPNLYVPKNTKSRKKRVWLPYHGPELVWLVPTLDVPLHPKSTVEIESACETCRRLVYAEINGISRVQGGSIIPRDKEKGLFFQEEDLNGRNIFRPKDTGFYCCTDEVKAEIESIGSEGCLFLEVGEVVPSSN